ARPGDLGPLPEIHHRLCAHLHHHPAGGALGLSTDRRQGEVSDGPGQYLPRYFLRADLLHDWRAEQLPQAVGGRHRAFGRCLFAGAFRVCHLGWLGDLAFILRRSEAAARELTGGYHAATTATQNRRRNAQDARRAAPADREEVDFLEPRPRHRAVDRAGRDQQNIHPSLSNQESARACFKGICWPAFLFVRRPLWATSEHQYRPEIARRPRNFNLGAAAQWSIAGWQIEFETILCKLLS